MTECPAWQACCTTAPTSVPVTYQEGILLGCLSACLHTTCYPELLWGPHGLFPPSVAPYYVRVLHIISISYMLTFLPASLSKLPSLSLFRDPCHKKILKLEANSLLQLGAVKPVPPPDKWKGFYTRFFLIPQKKRGLDTHLGPYIIYI